MQLQRLGLCDVRRALAVAVLSTLSVYYLVRLYLLVLFATPSFLICLSCILGRGRHVLLGVWFYLGLGMSGGRVEHVLELHLTYLPPSSQSGVTGSTLLTYPPSEHTRVTYVTVALTSRPLAGAASCARGAPPSARVCMRLSQNSDGSESMCVCVMVWWERGTYRTRPGAGYLRRAGSPAARPHELTYLPPERFGLACGSPAAYLLTPQRFGRPGGRPLTYLPLTLNSHLTYLS